MQRKYVIINNEIDNRIKIVDCDGFAFSDAKSVKGAVIGALVLGIRLKDIDFNGNYVPIKECLEVVM